MPDKNSPEGTAKWIDRPMAAGRAVPVLAFCAAAAALWFLAGPGLDNDSYYMIAQGREILRSGIPRTNGFTYYDGFAITVQQWAYCAAMAALDRIPWNIGLAAFALVQMAACLALMARRIGRLCPDPFWKWAVAAIVAAASTPGYFFSLRPENLTVILLLLQCDAMDRYRDTGKAKWLAALPALMVLEMNLHGSMWLFHFCVLLAYLVPPLRFYTAYVPDGSVRLSKHVAIAVLAMAAAVFASPYGLDGALYFARSVSVFERVPMVEQAMTAFMTSHGAQVLLLAGLSALAVYKKCLPSEALHMCAGFGVLAMTSYHNGMFLGIAFAYLASALLGRYQESGPDRASGTMTNGVWILVWLGAAAACASLAFSIPALRDMKSSDTRMPAAMWLADQPAGNILNSPDMGPVLEYAGLTGVMCDTRPELMSEKINKAYPADRDIAWFRTGLYGRTVREEYGTFQAYLDRHEIRYVVDIWDDPSYGALVSWLREDPGWKLAFSPADPGGYAVWTRKGERT